MVNKPENSKIFQRTFASRWKRTLIYGFFLALTTSGIFIWYIARTDWKNPLFRLVDMIAGTAYRPYVYRALIPFLVRVLEGIYPLRPELYAFGLMFLTLVGFVLTLRSFAVYFWKSDRKADLVSLLSIIGLIPFIARDGKIYDFPDLFLFTLGLLFIVRQQWKGFFIVYLLGCFNKETMVLLSLVFAVYYFRRMPAREFWALLIGQTLLFGAIKLFITWVFRSNPGGVVEYHLVEQIKGLLYLPDFLLFYGSFALCTVIFVLVDWRKKPEYLRLAAGALLPALLVANLFFGVPYEIRTYLDVYPVLFLLSIPTLERTLRIVFRKVSFSSFHRISDR
jgi:hypothetical protein